MNAALVLDCSVAATWCFEDEASAATDAVLDRVRNEGAAVPALWHWEVANVLALAVRRNRIAPAHAQRRLTLFGALPIVTDPEGPARAWREVYALAQTHGLTAYDAAYLELAQRTGLELASKDAELCAAASAVGVKLAL